MNGAAKRFFLDTNVLIYAHDVDAGHKHEQCLALHCERAGLERGLPVSFSLLTFDPLGQFADFNGLLGRCDRVEPCV